MARSRPRRCAGVKPDGSPCLANPLEGKDYCRFHDPESVEARLEASRRGGENRAPRNTLPEDTPDIPLRTVADVVAMLGQTINEVRRGQLAASIGNCLAILASTLIRAMEGSEHEQRIAALEARADQQSRRRAG